MTVRWPVCPGIRPPSGVSNQFLLQFRGKYFQTCKIWGFNDCDYDVTKCGSCKNLTRATLRNIPDDAILIFRHLCFCSYGAPCLTRRRVSNLIIQVLLGISSPVTLRPKSHRTLDHILLSHLRLGSLYVTSYISQGYGGGILSRLHSGLMWADFTENASRWIFKKLWNSTEYHREIFTFLHVK
jgi:hypothetical protein